MPFNIGPGELILILVIALVVLGPGKLPDVASSLGKSIREFRKAATDVTDAAKVDISATPNATAASTASAAPTPAVPVLAPPPPPVAEAQATASDGAAPSGDSSAS